MNPASSGLTGRFSVMAATLGPIGYIRWVPGTWGSAVGAVIWWFGLSGLSLNFQVAIILTVSLVAVWCSGQAEIYLGKTDPHPVIIDEVVGQWVALLLCPRQLIWVLAAFLLFRFFDVVKPSVIGQSQKLPGGWGIVIDDLLAGIATVISLAIAFFPRTLVFQRIFM